MVDGFVVFLEREPSEGHSFLFYLNYNYSIRAFNSYDLHEGED